MLFALLLILSLPTDWVPARWHWLETKTLELISGTPVNCLLVDWDPLQKTQAAAFAGAAAERGIATLAVIRPVQTNFWQLLLVFLFLFLA